MAPKTKTDPRTPQEFPSVIEEMEREAALQSRLRVARERRDALEEELRLQPKGAARVAKRAAALLSDVQIDLREVADLREELAQAAEEVEIVQEACRLAGEAVGRERLKASQAICRERVAEHKAIVQRIAAALAVVDEANAAEVAFRDVLEASGVAICSPVAGYASFLKRDSWQSHYQYWLGEMKAANYL